MPSLSKVLSQVEQLIRLATNSGATADEARTAAYAAVKLIHKYHLVVTPFEVPAPVRYETKTKTTTTYEYGWAPRQSEKDGLSRRGNLVVCRRAKRDFYCRACRSVIWEGEKMWHEFNYGKTHKDCGKPR